MIRIGLISRIALLVVCVEVAAFGALGAFYIDRFSTAADEQMRSRLQLVGRMIANDELAVSAISRQSLMGDLVHAPYLNGLVIGGNGRVIVSTNPAYLGRPADSIPGFDARWIADSAPDEQLIPGENTLTGITHIRSASASSSIYRTVITVSTAELNAQKRSIALWGQIGSALFILLSSAGIVFIAQGLITRRVNASLAVLKKVEDGALDARISVSSDDELGQLQHGINSMTAKVGALLDQHRRNEEELSAILNAIGDGVIAVGPDGGILRCNPSAAAILGERPDFFGNRRLVELLPELSGEDNPRWWRSPESLTARGRVHFERQSPDGNVRFIELGHGPIKEPDGTVIGAVLILQDITARKRAEEKTRKFEDELRHLNESLERRVQEEVANNREKDAMLIQQSRLATMGEMMHNVAHQWRQPLSALSIILSNIKDDFEWGEMNHESLARQVGNGIALAKKMSSTIDDFRNFFRPDHATSRFRLKDSVSEVLNLVGPSFRHNEIQVVVEAEDDCSVEGYANEYSQVLLNVLSNAKDALVGRGGTGVVHISIGTNDGMGEVRISDNGGGIREDALPKIFDPYFTTKESGSGIGLYMSRMIMGHMHGHITARNIDGGAEFVISVPLAA